MSFSTVDNEYYRMRQYPHPFSLTHSTKIIELKGYKDQLLNDMDRGALLSRYSRSTKSLLDVLDKEFIPNKNKGIEFYQKWLNEYGDDSIAELASKQIGIEGISILAASELTDRRLGMSFLEKSTRYLPFSADSFYIPGEFYTYGIVDEFRELCGLSHKTFQFIDNEIQQLLSEQYPIQNCSFARDDELITYSQLKGEEIALADKAYHSAIRDRSFDNASYAWLNALITNIGFNANCRAIEYTLHKLNASRLSELNTLGGNMLSLLNESIAPFLGRINAQQEGVITEYLQANTNTFNTYHPDDSSMVSVYKHNVVNLLKPYDTFQEDIENLEQKDRKLSPEHIKRAEQQKNHKKTSMSILNQILHDNKQLSFVKPTNPVFVDQDRFKPHVTLVDHRDETRAINMLCSAILWEYNENLLDYDDINLNNLDNNMRIIPLDSNGIQSGILYDLINNNKTLDEIANLYDDLHLNRITENSLSLGDFITYFEESATTFDTTLYQDYDSTRLVMTKDQQFLINQYVKNRKNRRHTLGRAFEMIDYCFDLTSSFRVFRDLKRHRINTMIKNPVITGRNTYENYIFPDLILKNEQLFNSYKNLIQKSFELYEKLIKKTGDYVAAQYIHPMGIKHTYSLKINARALDYLISLRTIPQGHEEYREIAALLYNTVKIVHPSIAKQMKFVDLNKYSLGRINYEYKKEKKLSHSS